MGRVDLFFHRSEKEEVAEEGKQGLKQSRNLLQAEPGFTMAWLSWGRLEEELGYIPIAREKYSLGCKTNMHKGSVQLWQVNHCRGVLDSLDDLCIMPRMRISFLSL